MSDGRLVAWRLGSRATAALCATLAVRRMEMSRLDRVRAHRVGGPALKAIVGVAGGAIVILGLILVPLPGPGWLIVVAGLAVLAIEFVWAQRLLEFTKRQLERWTDWVKAQSMPIRL